MCVYIIEKKGDDDAFAPHAIIIRFVRGACVPQSSI